ncbi:hypothetical protein ACIQWR_24480 [Streptomyces sp. NPDC098789]|uniref:hypothetical protein n=1 Tax=Streptomyces sp. NPDC098789 TaxID=3366098 RepID=UPI00380F48FA
MNAEPAPTPAADTSSGELPEAVAALHGDVGWESAMGILMAWVPRTAAEERVALHRLGPATNPTPTS